MSEEPQIHLNPDGTYLSPLQIVRALLDNGMGEGAAALLYDEAPTMRDMILFHHGTGRWVRNRFGLWRPDNPHTQLDPPPSDLTGLVDHPRFPDNLSGAIMEAVWLCLMAGYDPAVACWLRGL
jgi:hypothetical protein